MLQRVDGFRLRYGRILKLAGLIALAFVLFSVSRVAAQDPQPPSGLADVCRPSQRRCNGGYAGIVGAPVIGI